ncbi:MAG: isoamylase early set domain-containing protein [Gemmatimonadaceae bacterium]
MVHDEYDPFIDEIARELRQPVTLDAQFDSRVMAAIEPAVIPIRVHQTSRRAWYRRTFAFSASQLGGMAAAAALVGVVAMSALREGAVPLRDTVRATGELQLQPVANVTRAPSTRLVQQQFIIIAPSATSMSLVGDFNDWDETRNPMRRVSEDGAWSITLPLTPGRYEYQFEIDGKIRITDPTRPQASSDFGSANSVVTVDFRE